MTFASLLSMAEFFSLLVSITLGIGVLTMLAVGVWIIAIEALCRAFGITRMVCAWYRATHATNAAAKDKLHGRP